MNSDSPLLDLTDSPSFCDDRCPSQLDAPPMTTTVALCSPTPSQQHIESTTSLHSPTQSQ